MLMCKLFFQFFHAYLAAINLKKAQVFCVVFIRARKLDLF